ncbi:MAG: glycosyltransferase [Alphaproteobacteria bacterium]
MKLLLVSFFFPPYNAIGAVRISKLAKFLVDNGHEVRVLTAAGQDLPDTLPLEIPQAWITATPWWNVNHLPYALLGRSESAYRRGDAAMSPFLARLRRTYQAAFNLPDGQIGWLPHATRAGKKLIGDWRPDLIYCSASPFTALLVGRRLSRWSGIPWVAEFRDLWVDNPYIARPPWRRWLEQRLEAATVPTASGLVTVSEPMAALLEEKFSIPTLTVLNGYDPDDYPSTPPPPGDREHLTITYTGMIYPGRRDPTPLFQALQRMGDKRRHIRIHFVGRALPEVMLQAERLGVADCVEIAEPVPFHDSIRLQCASDILLLLLWNHPAEKGVYTGKLFEYLGAKRPILAIGLQDGVAAALIRNRNAGTVSNDPATIESTLLAWLAEKRRTGTVPAIDAGADGFTRRDQFAKIEHALADWTRPKAG